MLVIRFDEVVRRWMQATNTVTELELCRKLGVAPSSISVWRRRDSVPYKLLVDWCAQHRISVDWLMFGSRVLRRLD